MIKEDYTYIHLKGHEYVFSPICGTIKTDKPLDIITIKAKRDLQYYTAGKETCIGHCAMIVNGEFTLRGQSIIIDSVCPCTKKEIANFTKVLAEHNMYYGEYTITREQCRFEYGKGYIKETKYEPAYGLLWKEKDLFPIILNGKQIYYKDLQDELKGKYMSIGGDNGYSHYWSDSQKAEKVISVIEQMFAPNKPSSAFGNGHVIFGDLYGYYFENGALKVRLTEQPTERISVVSNT